MVTDQTKAVLKEAFDGLDANHDGVLSLADWIRNERPPKPPSTASAPIAGGPFALNLIIIQFVRDNANRVASRRRADASEPVSRSETPPVGTRCILWLHAA